MRGEATISNTNHSTSLSFRPKHGTAAVQDSPSGSSPVQSFWPREANPIDRSNSRTPSLQRVIDLPQTRDKHAPTAGSVNFKEFVNQKFIPEYAAGRRSTGRAHFHAILKLVLRPGPDQCHDPDGSNRRYRANEDWPYMDSLRLSEVTEERIRHLTTVAIGSGYSIQTATHVRNLIRAIFSHAIGSGFHTGENPAKRVALPAITRKEGHTLTLLQLREIVPVLRDPELGVALFSLLTEMNLAEICGLQWKYVNLLDKAQPVDTYRIPPKSVAVRNQSYRGRFEPVLVCRRRFLPLPKTLYSMLIDLRSRSPFTSPHDFVMASRAGTPIHPENIAARRLKEIGKSMDIPWLSWSVFHRTNRSLKSRFGSDLQQEYERIFMASHSIAPGDPEPARERGRREL